MKKKVNPAAAATADGAQGIASNDTANVAQPGIAANGLLVPNTADISAHLYTLFAPEFVAPYSDSWIELAYINPTNEKIKCEHFSPFELDKAVAFAEKKNKARFNLYVGATLRHGTTGPKSAGRASRVNALMATYAWSEFDKEGDDAKVGATLKEEHLVPAMVLTTGRTPHPRRHVYLKLAGGVTPDEVEKANIALKTLFGSDAVQDPARLMRLAGTISYPKPEKIERGYVTELVTLHIRKDAPSYTVEHLMGVAGTTGGPSPGPDVGKDDSPHLDWAKVAEHDGWLKTAGDLPMDFGPKGKLIVAHSGTLNDLNIDLQREGYIEKKYGSWSDVSFALAAVFKADSRFTREQIAAALLCNLPCNQHVTKYKDEVQRKRAVERLLTRSHEPTAQRIARALPWRECKANGAPSPSMHNARLAITALGIECSYDTFHDKLLFGFKDDTVRHVLQPVMGEVSDVDNGIISLRQLLSDRFGFDLTERHVRDAVISLAQQHRFNPVLNMLAEAEGKWDGVKRLDRMAADYLSCEDTPLNSACMRKTMIAGVARVRNPGCKFDNITILESPEGWNKSSAWSVLAGDAENFSDEKIIGKDSREVQEQLANVWIHENAELAGMKKADIDTVKAFARRQVDRARPAYGHFLKQQPRHSIEVGTINPDGGGEYYQSQTGNRAFWGMKVLKAIDLEKLKQDRDQLWGEAAHYQSHGESLTLPELMWPVAGVEQEKRRAKDPWEDIIANLPAEVHIDNDGEERRTITIMHEVDDHELRVATFDLLTYVLRIPVGLQNRSHAMRLSTVMKLAGWEHSENKLWIDGKQQRGYFRTDGTQWVM